MSVKYESYVAGCCSFSGTMGVAGGRPCAVKLNSVVMSAIVWLMKNPSMMTCETMATTSSVWRSSHFWQLFTTFVFSV